MRNLQLANKSVLRGALTKLIMNMLSTNQEKGKL